VRDVQGGQRSLEEPAGSGGVAPDRFYERVKERGATPDVEVRLREQIAKLKKTVANKDKELTQLRSDVPELVRVINQITAENTELREALKIPLTNVVPLRAAAAVRPWTSSDRNVATWRSFSGRWHDVVDGGGAGDGQQPYGRPS
jgi:hypothetical protein